MIHLSPIQLTQQAMKLVAVCVHCQFTAQVILDASHFRDGKSRKAVWTT